MVILLEGPPFAGVLKLEDLDPANHTARVTAQGSDPKGGGAHATASFRVEPADGGSKVLMHMDLVLSGGVARYGRDTGIIQATAAQIMTQFAANLRAQVAGRA
jgi:carbon monoxide dehydrogenase subunit G